MRCRVSGRTSVGICRAYKCRYLDRDRYLRHEGHIAPQPSSATSPHVVARLALSWPSAIHRLLIHQHTPRNQPASASKQTLPSLFRSVPPSASCLSAMPLLPLLPFLPFLPSLPITSLGPISAYLRIVPALPPSMPSYPRPSLHPHPQPEHLNTSEHVGPLSQPVPP
jgi:hypothetical protein